MKLCLKIILFSSLIFACSNLVAKITSPFSLSYYGNFIQMMKTGEAPGNISLQQMQSHEHLYGVGALQSLGGEVTILNGNILVSRGEAKDGYVSKVTSKDSATLLAIAVVKNWVSVPITHSMSKKEFERFLLQSAIKNGISLNYAFPFLVQGKIKNLQWHVVRGLQSSTNKTSMYAKKNHFEATNINGTLVGFYTSKQLEGIISHGGDLFHLHFADPTLRHAGHVDAYVMGANAVLFLPKINEDREMRQG